MSDSNEYICISCWTGFVAQSNASGEVICPHCDFAQPAAERSSAGDNAPPPTDAASDLDQTLADVRMPWADGAGSGKGLESISFDDLEDLEQLLGGTTKTGTTTKAGTPRAGRTAKPPHDTVQSAAPPIDARAEEAAPSADKRTQEPPERMPSAEAQPDEGGATLWRLKSAGGLTYNFYDVEALRRWADGLGSDTGVLVSLDGITWKELAKVRSSLTSAKNGIEAFMGAEAAVVSGRARASTQRPASAGTSPGTGRGGPKRTASVPRAGSRARAATTTEGRGTSSALMAVAAEAMAAEDAKSRTQTGQRPRPRGSRQSARTSSGVQAVRGSAATRASGWQDRVAFAGIGALLGGLGVYVGMYLLGYYDLVLSF